MSDIPPPTPDRRHVAAQETARENMLRRQRDGALRNILIRRELVPQFAQAAGGDEEAHTWIANQLLGHIEGTVTNGWEHAVTRTRNRMYEERPPGTPWSQIAPPTPLDILRDVYLREAEQVEYMTRGVNVANRGEEPQWASGYTRLMEVNREDLENAAAQAERQRREAAQPHRRLMRWARGGEQTHADAPSPTPFDLETIQTHTDAIRHAINPHNDPQLARQIDEILFGNPPLSSAGLGDLLHTGVPDPFWDNPHRSGAETPHIDMEEYRQQLIGHLGEAALQDEHTPLSDDTVLEWFSLVGNQPSGDVRRDFAAIASQSEATWEEIMGAPRIIVRQALATLATEARTAGITPQQVLERKLAEVQQLQGSGTRYQDAWLHVMAPPSPPAQTASREGTALDEQATARGEFLRTMGRAFDRDNPDNGRKIAEQRLAEKARARSERERIPFGQAYLAEVDEWRAASAPAAPNLHPSAEAGPQTGPNK